jgi:hypothetical protein
MGWILSICTSPKVLFDDGKFFAHRARGAILKIADQRNAVPAAAGEPPG